MKAVKIADRIISDETPVFIIAELSANHSGSLETALESVRAIKRAGADCIKLQTYTPETITLKCDNEYFRINHGTLWDGMTLYDLYEQAQTPWEWHKDIKNLADELGLICFSSPFDRRAIDYLEELNMPAYKIASFEIHDIPLIEYAASKGKPVIFSTGIASEEDIVTAVEACKRQSNEQIILLKCTSAYPAKLEDANLRSVVDIRAKFGFYAGLSDHTLGSLAPTVAVALGARVVEKHFILDHSIQSADEPFSLDENEFKQLVDDIRSTEKALGRATFELGDDAKKNQKFGRSIFVAEDIQSGAVLNASNIRSVRPGNGLPPKYLPGLYGMKANRDLKMGTPFSLDYVAKPSTD